MAVSPLAQYRTVFATKVGLPPEKVQKYYNDNIFITAQELDSQNAESGVQKAIDFYRTGRAYGGSYSSLYVNDLKDAVVSYWRDIAKSIEFVDTACGAGLSTLSGASIFEWIKQEYQKAGTIVDYSVKGVDISEECIQRAKSSQYSEDEIKNGLYFSQEAKKADKKLNFAQGDRAVSAKQAQSKIINNLMTPFIFDQKGDNSYSVKPTIQSKIQYLTMNPFGLTSALKERKSDFASAIHLFGLLSDQGKATMLTDLGKSLKPGGILFHDLLFGAIKTPQGFRPYQNPGEFFTSNPLTSSVIQEKFHFLPNSLTNSFYPSLLRTK